MQPGFSMLRHAWEHQALHAHRGFSVMHAVARAAAPSFVRRDVSATRVVGTVGPIIGEVTTGSASVVIEVRRSLARAR